VPKQDASTNQIIILCTGQAAGIPLKSEKDGYGRILNLINISFLLGYVGLIPILLMFCSFVRNDLTRPIWCVFEKLALLLGFTGAQETSSTVIMVFWVFLVGLSCINGLLNINLFVTAAIVYTNSTRLWMTKLRWETVLVLSILVLNVNLIGFWHSIQLESERDLRDIRKHQLTYTAHQVLNKFANDVFANIVEFALYVAAILLTLAIYVVVRFYRNGYAVLPLFLIFGSIICFSLVSCLVLASSCHSTSAHCCQVQKKCGSLNGKHDNMFWISRKPTSIRVGHQFSLRSKTYVLEVFGDTVLNTVIDLLVTF